jgi:type IV pilus assembly protein PilA
LLQRLRSRLNREEGFTLIELLVVILIIGILAAIAIPSFLNQRGKGEDASAKSNARTAQTAFETYFTDKGDYNCGSTCVADLRAIESQIPATGVAATGTANSYEVVATSKENRTFKIARAADGTVTRTCNVPGANRGGCPTGDSW